FELEIMTENQTLGDITTKVLLGMQGVIAKTKPDVVLVHGDTTTSFAAALAAFYSKVRVGHVEAGLRTYNKYSPFPEEMNRNLVSKIADIHFAPTQGNKAA
ncbi:MAG: UDP-N-acetylglucosamine 2-epimerase, partial [Oscillospiraceae bacterium]